jgi:hypothetical protein
VTSWAARAKVHLSHKAHKGTDETDEIGVLSVLSVHTGALYEKRESANDPSPPPETRAEPIPQPVDAALTVAASDPDRHCWPNTEAMTGSEIDTFTARLIRFTGKGVNHTDAEQLADKLVARDRQQDDRRHCLECLHLTGYGAGSWRCKNWQGAGVAIQARDAALPGDLVRTLQRCNGFTDTTKPI